MKVLRLLALSLLAASMSLTVGAQVSNTGAPQPAVIGLHDLTPPSPDGGPRILYAPSDPDDAVYRGAIAALTGGVVDYFDASANTPSLGMLATYDCVYTWTNLVYSDSVLFGNNLADYVDGGGRVVLGVFTTYTQGNSLAGRILTTGYSPVANPTGGNQFSSSTYDGTGTTPIHTGVTTYECGFRDMLTLQGAGLQDGGYVDTEIAHAYRPDFNVVYSNGSGAAPLTCTGQWAELIANSCNAQDLGGIFSDGFETGDTSRWSTTVGGFGV